jgi:serine/threonine protein kinase
MRDRFSVDLEGLPLPVQQRIDNVCVAFEDEMLKAGMDTKQVFARFDAERQALAMRDHPNIAKVFDAGATEKGRSYFVMELVQGEPITDFCGLPALQEFLGSFAKKIRLSRVRK